MSDVIDLIKLLSIFLEDDAQPRIRPERRTAALFGTRRAPRGGARSMRTLGG